MASIQELEHEAFSRDCFPNHGILFGGVHPDCRPWWQAVTVCFYTERVHRERRFFAEAGTDCICVKENADGTLLEEYRPVRMAGGTTIVSSGMESEAIHSALLQGKGAYEALRFFRQREHFDLIPSRPLYPPRIFGLRERNGNFILSTLQAGPDDGPQQSIYEYSRGDRWISTVQPGGAPFSGEPVKIKLPSQPIRTLAEQIWEGLDPDTRVSLFVRYTDMRSGFPETVVINQFGKASCSAPQKPIWPTRRNRK